MRVDLFDFELPENLIATQPCVPRDASRLLYVPSDGNHQDENVLDIPSKLRPGDVMVFNDTKVIPARLYGKRGEMGVEILLHKPINDTEWLVFAKPAKRLKPDQTIIFSDDFNATILGRNENGHVHLRFNCDDLPACLERHGEMPLPPYMHRRADNDDKSTYQTVYAEHPGSVAAPTAGLHFTERLLNAIDATGTKRVHVTLHVGAGTFLPVKVDDTDDHVMHSEIAHVTQEVADIINTARQNGGRIICVGTTSLRTIESMTDTHGHTNAGTCDTDIFITPGYVFKGVDVLMTNFHLPKSTLIMLVSAFSGFDKMMNVYRHAIAEKYRFFSYGDACWLEKNN